MTYNFIQNLGWLVKNLLIKDEENPIAIAGVIGGKNTEIDDKTSNIFIESALFDPIIVRKSAKALDLSTDASRRYERFVDPKMARMIRKMFLISSL